MVAGFAGVYDLPWDDNADCPRWNRQVVLKFTCFVSNMVNFFFLSTSSIKQLGGEGVLMSLMVFKT